jgi:hypothetical protein
MLLPPEQKYTIRYKQGILYNNKKKEREKKRKEKRTLTTSPTNIQLQQIL